MEKVALKLILMCTVVNDDCSYLGNHVDFFFFCLFLCIEGTLLLLTQSFLYLL